MFIDKNSLKVNNISLGPYITKVEYQYNKLWGQDSGRNLAGTQSGTFLGVFPKIIVTFRKLSKGEFEYLAPLFDNPYQTVTYYDPIKRANTNMATYTGDYNFSDTNIVGQNSHKNEGFEVSFIAVSRRV